MSYLDTLEDAIELGADWDPVGDDLECGQVRHLIALLRDARKKIEGNIKVLCYCELGTERSLFTCGWCRWLESMEKGPDDE